MTSRDYVILPYIFYPLGIDVDLPVLPEAI